MKRTITIEQNHIDAATPGASTNVIARAVNDEIRSDYRATVTDSVIRIWEKDFKNHSLLDIPLPTALVNNNRNQKGSPADQWLKDKVPYSFDIELPEQYHRRPGRNVEEDMEFIRRHGE